MKTFNKVVSLITTIVFVISMLTIPAFAIVEDFPTPTGEEKLMVTYYSDAALTSQITTATPGSEVYAKITANLPTKTLGALDVNLNVANATIEGDETKLALTGFERYVQTGTIYNTIFDSKTGANIYITLADGSGGYDSPNNTKGYDYTCKTIDVIQFDINVYKLKVGDTGTVSFSNAGGVGLNIGDFDFAVEEVKTSPFTVEGTLAIGGGVTTKDATFVADFDENFEYANTLSNSELETAIKADLTVTKTVDGAPSDVDVSTLDINFNHTAKTFTVKFAKGLATGEVIKSGTDEEATFSYKVKAPAVTTYTFKAIEFNGTEVSGTFNADYATYYAGDALKNAIKVKAEKFVDGASQGVVDALNDDYEVIVANSTATNTANVTVNFKGNLAITGTKSLAVTYDNVPAVYSNIKAVLTTAEFANNTSADTVKSAVKVTATKTEGVIVTDNVDMALGTDYEVAIDGNPANVTENGFVTVTLIGKLAGLTLDPADGKINFAVTPDTIEYKDYVIEFEGGNTTFLATATDEDIKGKMTVKADKYVNGSKTGTEEVAPANFESVVIDRSTGLVTVTLKAGEPYNGETVTATITLKDVIEYRNVKATMSTRMFPAGTTDDTIKGALTIVADKYVNNVLDGAEQSALPADEYTVAIDTVDANNKTVKITYLEKCISVADAYKEFAVAVGINANAKITLSPAGTVNKDENFTAEISVEGLGTNKVYAAEIKISADKGTGSGTLVSFTPAAGYYKYSENMADGTVTVIRDTSETAGNILGTFTIKAAAVKDAEIVVKVEKLKLTTVEGDDIANLPSFTGDEQRIIVTEVVVPTTAKINASFNIQTLGDVASAKDKFIAGLKVTKGTDAVTLGADNVVVTEKKVELKDLEVGEGVYKVSLGVPGYTKAEVEIKVAYDAESNTMKVDYGTITGKEAIYAGDVNGDGVIDAVDYADLVAKIGQAVSENKNCDLYTKDGETVINLNDVITMVYEFETFFGKSFSTSGLILE